MSHGQSFIVHKKNTLSPVMVTFHLSQKACSFFHQLPIQGWGIPYNPSWIPVGSHDYQMLQNISFLPPSELRFAAASRSASNLTSPFTSKRICEGRHAMDPRLLWGEHAAETKVYTMQLYVYIYIIIQIYSLYESLHIKHIYIYYKCVYYKYEYIYICIYIYIMIMIKLSVYVTP